MFRVSKDSPIYYVTSVTHNRCWQRRPLENEPLAIDLDQISWHVTRGIAS